MPQTATQRHHLAGCLGPGRSGQGQRRGATSTLELGASKESQRYPDTHARFQATLRHLIESVKIEPFNAQLEAEQAELKRKARDVQREECKEMAKRTKPFKWCKDLLDQPMDR